MSFKILDSCIACGNCKPECPVDAIAEGDIFSIDESLCVECGACETVCPVGAPQQD